MYPLKTIVFLHCCLSTVSGACPSGTFGKDCSGECHCFNGHHSCHAETGKCSDGLCKEGWTNFPDCQTKCPKGFYGLNCASMCHCEANGGCDSVNGLCESGKCDYGWDGPACQNQMPVLRDPPFIKSLDADQLVLAWRPLLTATNATVNRDIAAYAVEMQNSSSKEWLTLSSVPASPGKTEYDLTVRDLRRNSKYRFRVKVVSLNSKKPQVSVPGPETQWVLVPCIAPSGTPKQLNVTLVARETLKISWQNPVEDSGCDGYGWHMVILTCLPICDPQSRRVDYPSSSTTMRLMRRHRSLNAMVSIEVQSFNNAGLGGPKPATLWVQPFRQEQIGADVNGSIFDDGSDVLGVEPALEVVTRMSSFEPGIGFEIKQRLLKRLESVFIVSVEFSELNLNSKDYRVEVAVTEIRSLSKDNPKIEPTVFIKSEVVTIISLNPVTLYAINITILAVLDKELPRLWSLRTYWTLSHPPPRLPVPQILEVTNSTIGLVLEKRNTVVKRSEKETPVIEGGFLVIVEPELGSARSEFQRFTENKDDLIYDSLVNGTGFDPLSGTVSDIKVPFYVAVMLVDLPPDGKVTVGDDGFYGSQKQYHNIPLMAGTRYWVWVGARRIFAGAARYTVTPLPEQVRTKGLIGSGFRSEEYREDDEGREGDEDEGGGGLDGGSIAAIILALLIIILLGLLAFFWYYYVYRPRNRWQDTPVRRPILTPVRTVSVQYEERQPDPEPEEPEEPEIPVKKPPKGTFDSSFYFMKSNRPIPVHKLRHHYETHLRPNSHYALQDEYRHLPDGFTDTTNVANLPYNVALNRSQANIPYDKNRVKLAKLDPRHGSYINASYIRTIGYRPCIVTQCPMVSTIDDFWRMVWEMRVGTIVMLMDSRETNGPDSFRYWPVRSKTIQYRDLEVETMREDRLAHYYVRAFKVTFDGDKGSQTRRVIQWQYVKWKSGGLPSHPIPFLNMVESIQEEHDRDSGVVIHCLKGGGRSGIYCAVDALVQEGKRTGNVDVMECVTLLRLERVELVKSLKQYRFLYQCLIEAFNCHETRVPVSRFHFLLANLFVRNELDSLTRFEKEYSALKLECYAIKPHVSSKCPASVGSSPEPNKTSPRSLGIVKTSDLADKICRTSAIVIDGCFTRGSFILSSSPEASKLVEFWDRVVDSNACCVVMLNSIDRVPFSGRFLPEEGSVVQNGRYTISCQSSLIHPNMSFYLRNISITFTKQKANRSNNNSNMSINNRYPNNKSPTNSLTPLRFYELTKWKHCLEVPPVNAILDLTISVVDWSQRVGSGRPTILFSVDGGDRARAALFSIICLMIDPIDYDGRVDVYAAARYVCSHFPLAVTSMDQYRFLYSVMEEHVTRIERNRWRPERISDGFTPSPLPMDSLDKECEFSQSRELTKYERWKKLRKLPSRSSSSMLKKKRRPKCVKGRATGDESGGSADESGGLRSDTCQRAVREEGSKRAAVAKKDSPVNPWQSPEKDARCFYPGVDGKQGGTEQKYDVDVLFLSKPRSKKSFGSTDESVRIPASATSSRCLRRSRSQRQARDGSRRRSPRRLTPRGSPTSSTSWDEAAGPAPLTGVRSRISCICTMVPEKEVCETTRKVEPPCKAPVSPLDTCVKIPPKESPLPKTSPTKTEKRICEKTQKSCSPTRVPLKPTPQRSCSPTPVPLKPTPQRSYSPSPVPLKPTPTSSFTLKSNLRPKSDKKEPKPKRSNKVLRQKSATKRSPSRERTTRSRSPPAKLSPSRLSPSRKTGSRQKFASSSGESSGAGASRSPTRTVSSERQKKLRDWKPAVGLRGSAEKDLTCEAPSPRTPERYRSFLGEVASPSATSLLGRTKDKKTPGRKTSKHSSSRGPYGTEGSSSSQIQKSGKLDFGQPKFSSTPVKGRSTPVERDASPKKPRDRSLVKHRRSPVKASTRSRKPTSRSPSKEPTFRNQSGSRSSSKDTKISGRTRLTNSDRPRKVSSPRKHSVGSKKRTKTRAVSGARKRSPREKVTTAKDTRGRDQSNPDPEESCAKSISREVSSTSERDPIVTTPQAVPSVEKIPRRIAAELELRNDKQRLFREDQAQRRDQSPSVSCQRNPEYDSKIQSPAILVTPPNKGSRNEASDDLLRSGKRSKETLVLARKKLSNIDSNSATSIGSRKEVSTKKNLDPLRKNYPSDFSIRDQINYSESLDVCCSSNQKQEAGQPGLKSSSSYVTPGLNPDSSKKQRSPAKPEMLESSKHPIPPSVDYRNVPSMGEVFLDDPSAGIFPVPSRSRSGILPPSPADSRQNVSTLREGRRPRSPTNSRDGKTTSESSCKGQGFSAGGSDIPYIDESEGSGVSITGAKKTRGFVHKSPSKSQNI